ncbi:hypothetical protein Tco_0328153 [Tanacetum coccineum]
MRTRSQSRNLHNQQHQGPPPVVEPFNLEDPLENPPPPPPPMDDQRTMAQLLEAPTAGYEDAIVVPEITADNFELKHGLLNLVQNKQFFGHDKEDPHAHIRYFNKITSTMKFPNVPSQNMQNQLTNLTDMLSKFVTSNTASTSGTLPSNTVTNPKEDLKGITTRSGVAYKGPTIHTTSSPKVVEREPEVTKDTMPPTNNGSTEDIPPPVVPIVHHESISEPVNAPVSASRPNQKASIPFPSRRNDERRREKANDQIEKFYEIFRDLSFEISFTDALMLMPKFASTLKTLIGNKEKNLQEVLGFSNVISSGNPTPYYDPIVSTTSPTLTPFGDSDFLLFEEADSFLAIEDDPTSPEVDPTYYDPDGDILLLEAILNSDPSPPPPNQGNYFPETRKDLKICEANSSVNEPPEVELKDLPPHLEYAFLEGDDKLPVIIAKDLKNEEKAALIEVLKSHKRAIAWKLSDIKGINPEFCTHKILMEEDYEPTVQHQRRVNPKIHDVIKKEVEKLLDAGLIYPISDSPWVSPVHCVPKKGGMTVVKNDENDLIPTRLVTGWRVCIDYRKLNEATRKDHFPLPFMDQMLERLAGNQFYCFLDAMAFRVISRFPYTQRIKKIQPLLAHTEHLPIVACLLGYAMHLARSNDV